MLLQVLCVCAFEQSCCQRLFYSCQEYVVMCPCSFWTKCHANLLVNNNNNTVLLFLLQVPFARYIARCGVSYLKRYSIDNVYRESRLAGLHPRELAACSFDIVTTPGGQSFVADAEVIAIVSEIVSEIPNLAGRNCQLRVNHTALVKAMLLHCGIAESLHADIYAILGDSKVCGKFL